MLRGHHKDLSSLEGVGKRHWSLPVTNLVCRRGSALGLNLSGDQELGTHLLEGQVDEVDLVERLWSIDYVVS